MCDGRLNVVDTENGYDVWNGVKGRQGDFPEWRLNCQKEKKNSSSVWRECRHIYPDIYIHVRR